MITRRANSSFLSCLLLTAACTYYTDPEDVPLTQEYAWAGSHGVVSGGIAGDGAAASIADSVIYALFTEIDEWTGRADGVLTVMNDTTRWRYDPYYGLVEGFMTRDSDAPAHMLVELTREHDGTACRMSGPVDSVGLWTSELTCGGSMVDTVQLLPTPHGFLTGWLTQGDQGRHTADGARVQYCPLLDNGRFRLRNCKVAGYTERDGVIRLRVPPGKWFIIFSYWYRTRWTYCRSSSGSSSYTGRHVTVRVGQASDASTSCRVWD